MVRLYIFLQFYTVLILIITVSCKPPDYIQICQRTDPNLDQCIINSIEHLKPYLKEGITEIDVPPLDPLRLNTLYLNLGTGDTKIITNVTDLVVHGAHTFHVNQLWSNINKNSFRYNVTIALLNLEGIYEIDTNLLFLHIQGKGNITIDVENYNFECTMSGNKIKIGNTEHLQFDVLNCELQFEKARAHLDNLFNGNQLIGNAVNDVVNDNVDIFFNEIKPKLTEALENVFLDVANKITLRFTYDELFP